jgi:NAD(P)-dependent dehydrogenase (short-subunit alcohol dehydrogenase family)
MRFAGKSILVAGAARGMGAEHVRQLVAQGARVIFSDVLEAQGAALAAELGPTAHFVRQDVQSSYVTGADIVIDGGLGLQAARAVRPVYFVK